MLLEQDGGGNRLGYRGCRWIPPNVLRSSFGLVRVVMDSLRRYPFHKRFGFIVPLLDFADEVPGFSRGVAEADFTRDEFWKQRVAQGGEGA